MPQYIHYLTQNCKKNKKKEFTILFTSRETKQDIIKYIFFITHRYCEPHQKQRLHLLRLLLKLIQQLLDLVDNDNYKLRHLQKQSIHLKKCKGKNRDT